SRSCSVTRDLERDSHCLNRVFLPDSPSVRIYVGDAVERHRVGTVTAILWDILFRASLEALKVVCGSKPIGHSLPSIGILIHAFSRLPDGEICDGVIAFKGETVLGVDRKTGR